MVQQVAPPGRHFHIMSGSVVIPSVDAEIVLQTVFDGHLEYLQFQSIVILRPHRGFNHVMQVGVCKQSYLQLHSLLSPSCRTQIF